MEDNEEVVPVEAEARISPEPEVIQTMEVEPKKKMPKGLKIALIIIGVLVVIPSILIFLVSILAVPQLQSSRRDTLRKSDVGRTMIAVENFATENDGRYPASQADVDRVKGVYLVAGNSGSSSTDNVVYELIYSSATIDRLNPGVEVAEMYVVGGRACDDGLDSRYVSVIVGLEEGGKYCQDTR